MLLLLPMPCFDAYAMLTRERYFMLMLPLLMLPLYDAYARYLRRLRCRFS